MKLYVITTPSGIYYARFQQPDGKWTTRSLHTKNEADAKVALGKLSLSLKQEGWDLPGPTESPTLEELIPGYIQYTRRRRSLGWAEKQRQYLYGPIKEFFGLQTIVGMISPARIEAYANHRADHVRGVTVNRELSCIRSLFKWCKNQGYAHNNPARDIEFLDDEVQVIRRFLSTDEYDVLGQTAHRIVRDDPYYHVRPHFRDLEELLEFGCHTGLRLGELLHVEYQDIVNNTLLVRPKPQYHFRLKSSERQFPLDTQARHAIDQMRQKLNPDEPRVFWTHPSDSYATVKRDVQNSFTRLVQAATKELPSLYDVTPHTMRKTFGSWAVQAGASLQQVKELLGHSTIQVTEKFYAYLAPKNLQDAIHKLEDFCAGPKNEYDKNE